MNLYFFQKYQGDQLEQPSMRAQDEDDGTFTFFLVQTFINAQEELKIKNVFVILILECRIDTLIYLCAYGNTQLFTSLKIKSKVSLLNL